ncbi:MAG TPA: PAS domain S-box protein, partial [bacterium]
QACWSEPIRSSQGEVLGTLAMYYRQPRSPDQASLEFIHDAGLLAGIAIEQRQTEDALHRSRSLLQVVVDTLPHTVFVKDLEERYIFVNRAKAAFHRMRQEDMIGKRVDEVPWGNRAELPAMIERNRQVLTTGQPLETSEETITDLNGELRFRHWYRLPLHSEKGEVMGLVSISEDITARKKAEAALEESETRFRQVVDTLPTMLWMTGPDALTTFVNRPWLEFTGRTLEQDLGHGWVDNLLEQDKAQAIETYLTSFRERVPFAMEYRVRRYDGEYRWCMDTGRPRYASNGEFLGYVGTVVDIGLAKRAHTQLVDAVESLPCAFMLFDVHEKLLLWNQNFVKFFPFAAQFLEYGMPFERLVRGTLKQSPQFASKSWPTSADERIREFRNPPTSKEYHLPDGRWFHATDQRTSEGGTVTLHFDITEQKQRDAALLQAQKMDALGQLTGGVAHDFNNLLQVISGYSALALVGARDDDHRTEPIRQVRDAAIRASNVVQQLLTFSRRQVVRAELLPLPLVLKNVASMLERLLGEHIALEVECDLGTPEVLADQGMIEQVIVNLAVNARDAMSAGGTLHLTTTERIIDTTFCHIHQWARPGRFAALTCTDTGCGMTPEVRRRIFEPFFTTKETGKGTGLGLSTVYGIVEQHQGFINVESEPNRGTRFEIFLPAANGGEADSSTPQ